MLICKENKNRCTSKKSLVRFDAVKPNRTFCLQYLFEFAGINWENPVPESDTKILTVHSGSSMARTPMAHLPCITRTRSRVFMIPYMRLLWSDSVVRLLYLSFYAVIFIFCFSDQRLLKIENENNNTKPP